MKECHSRLVKAQEIFFLGGGGGVKPNGRVYTFSLWVLNFGHIFGFWLKMLGFSYYTFRFMCQGLKPYFFTYIINIFVLF